jgi:hypothetical protein
MKHDEAVKWMQDVAARSVQVNSHRDVSGLFAEADAAIKAALPSHHSLVKRWDPLCSDVLGLVHVNNSAGVLGAFAVFQAAAKIAADGKLGSALESVRVETLSDLLDQADTLLRAFHIVAAAVVAGGALETHLRRLCDANGLAWTGEGSISKYEGALAIARNAGSEIISKTDGAVVKGWGSIRNDAAHDPINFKHTADEVRLMVDGIRQFLARTTP